MWDKLDKPWQECFSLSIESFKNGSIPIGAVLVNEQHEILSGGRNLINEISKEKGVIYKHKLAHAEINALLKISEFDHPNIRKYVLYTSMEPCPLCFGAMVMANIRSIKYATRDSWAGSTNLKNDYIASKHLNIEGPIPFLEDIYVALLTVFELEMYKENNLTEPLAKTSNRGYKAGIYLFKNNVLTDLLNNNEEAKIIYNTIYDILLRF